MDYNNSSIKFRIDHLKETYNLDDSESLKLLEKEIELYYTRYEKVRKLTVPEFSRIIKRNMKGEKFDDIIDNR